MTQLNFTSHVFEETIAFARTFTKKRPIFGELKKRMHKNIIEVMEIEDKKQIDALNLFIQD